jgi:TRAP-type mannitol/chloroaromatic compound transport system permease small subunit
MKRDRLQQWLTVVAVRIDRFSDWCGRGVAWLVLVMVLLVSWDVAMRYFFRSGSVALQELEWHLFSLIFLLGAAGTLKHDGHVRLDLLYHGRFLSDRGRAWINLAGGMLFLLPFCILIIVASWPFVSQSWMFGEHSPDPGGLPHRWILKSVIPLAFALLLVQGLGDIARNIAQLIRRPP